MSSIKFRITGFDDILNKLEAMEGAGTIIMRQGIEAGAKILEDEMKNNIEMHGLIKTGNLYQSIGTKVYSSGTKLMVAKIGQFGDAPYGLYHEFGTSKMPASPWLYPALDSKGYQAKIVTINHIRNEIIMIW